MSPSEFHAKKENTNPTNNNNVNGLLPPPLKINKDSHSIKKSSSSSSPPSSSSSSSSISSSSLVSSVMAQGVATSNKPLQRHPVIIYTHSPKIIHTHPRDFMALVQKLTGLSRSEEDGGGNNLLPPQQPPKQEVRSSMMAIKESDHKKVVVGNEDNETSSVITEENNCISNIGENQVNSCFMAGPPILEPPLNPYVTNLPVFQTSSHAEFIRSSQPLLNYSNSLFFSHNIMTSIPSSATLEGVNEFREY